MRPIEQSCDSTQIDDYLAGQLLAEQQADLEAHLTECQSCQMRLEERAAEQDVWDSARELLSSDQESQADGSDSGVSSGGNVHPGNMVLDLLGPTDDPEMLGRLGEYEISGVVGTGGMGAVLRGFDRSLRRVVAIKVMAPHLAGSGAARARFQREARAAAAITHDNIIDIHGVAEANHLPYIVMPFARGPSLQNRIDRSGPLTAIEVVRIGKQIASGLAAAHEQGLVHRDIKPANILLNEGVERLWITDFGVARAMDDASMTKTGVIAGTPQYMSPEQARGEAVDHRSDLFSLGSVLYTACTGRAPFRSEAAYGILRCITDTNPRPIREINPDIPDWLCQIIARLMAKHSTDRFQTAAEVAELLEGCLAHLQQPTNVALPSCIAEFELASDAAVSPEPTQPTDAGTANRHQRWLRSLVVGLMASIVLAGFGAIAWKATAPVDITGTWKGQNWDQVSLSSVAEATGWYNGTFTDNQGNRGAVNLEWSRLQRRYNGRWKSGDDQSGAITLRAGDPEEVRGAVSADPESELRANIPRLREFSWRRTSTEVAAIDRKDLPKWRQHATTPQSITTPYQGQIQRVGDNILENARLKQGDLIAVLATNDAGRSDLESQLEVAQQQVETSKLVVAAKKSQVSNAAANVTASEQRLVSYHRVQKEIVAGAEAAIEVEANKVKSAQARLDSIQAMAEQMQSAYDQRNELSKKGLASKQEVQSSEAKLEKAKAQIAEVQASLSAAKNEMLIKQRDRNAKEARAQIDIADAEASLSTARTALFDAEQSLVKATADIAKAEQKVTDIKQKLASSERYHFYAPRDGYITDVNIRPGQSLQPGDTLCLIWPDPSGGPVPIRYSEAESERQPRATSSAMQNTVLNSIPPRMGDTGQSLMAALGTAARIASRIRAGQSELAAAEETVSQDPQSVFANNQLDSIRTELSTLEQQKQTIVEMLQTRQQAAKELYQVQADLTSQIVAGTKAGKFSTHESMIANHSLATADRERTLINRLLAFYAKIDESDVASERKAIVEILQDQIEKTQKIYELQADITKAETFAFERGKLALNDALSARNSLTKAKADLSELKLLLNYYDDLDVSQYPPTQDTPTAED